MRLNFSHLDRLVSVEEVCAPNEVEQHNDQTLISMLILCTGIGFFFGAVTGRTLPAIGYAFVGAVIGAPAGFIINLTCNWRQDG
jgi:hypothetical protein